MSLAKPVDQTDHVLGPDDAPVTLVEYGDFQCPHCRAAHFYLRNVLATMGDDVRFVFRHMPPKRVPEWNVILYGGKHVTAGELKGSIPARVTE